MSTDLERARVDFAERLRQAVGLRSAALVRAFGTVPREHFVGPGPWKILVPPDLLAYRDTPGNDPRYLYDNVLVALDASRRLNNGEPAALARWLDTLDLATGRAFCTLVVASATTPPSPPRRCPKTVPSLVWKSTLNSQSAPAAT
jgi:protein-L-isoaspartate(D-aspartate) O-methyltransferase